MSARRIEHWAHQHFNAHFIPTLTRIPLPDPLKRSLPNQVHVRHAQRDVVAIHCSVSASSSPRERWRPATDLRASWAARTPPLPSKKRRPPEESRRLCWIACERDRLRVSSPRRSPENPKTRALAEGILLSSSNLPEIPHRPHAILLRPSNFARPILSVRAKALPALLKDLIHKSPASDHHPFREMPHLAA